MPCCLTSPEEWGSSVRRHRVGRGHGRLNSPLRPGEEQTGAEGQEGGGEDDPEVERQSGTERAAERAQHLGSQASAVLGTEQLGGGGGGGGGGGVGGGGGGGCARRAGGHAPSPRPSPPRRAPRRWCGRTCCTRWPRRAAPSPRSSARR